MSLAPPEKETWNDVSQVIKYAHIEPIRYSIF